MCLPCVGAVIFWTLAKASSSCGPIPPSITVASTSRSDLGHHVADGVTIALALPHHHPLDAGRPVESDADLACLAWAELGSLGGIIIDPHGIFADYWNADSSPLLGRVREIYPLPLPLTLDCSDMKKVHPEDALHALSFLHGTIAVLNF